MIPLALLAALVATPATFGSVAYKAQPADTIMLGCGNYGDQMLKAHAVHLSGQKCAVFHSLELYSSAASNSTLDGFTIPMTPDAKTFSASQALKILGTATSIIRNVKATNLTITCGNAVVGIMPDLDPTLKATQDAWKAAGQNVLGQPTGTGVGIGWADGVTLDHLNVSKCGKGVTVGGDNITITNSEIHHVRTSPITGSPGSGLTISHNYLHDSNPWGWGAAGGLGDHADMIHFLTVKGGKPIDRLTISDNLIDQGAGQAILGIHLDDQKTGLGFWNARVDLNTIILANTQGIRFENVHGSASNNKLFMPPNAVGKMPQIIVCADPKYCVPSDVTLTLNASGYLNGTDLADVRAAMRRQLGTVINIGSAPPSRPVAH